HASLAISSLPRRSSDLPADGWWQPRRNDREVEHEPQPYQLDDDERYDALVDVSRRYLRWSDALQEEQCPPERWGQERGLQVHRHQDGDPRHVDAACHKDRQEHRQGNV